MTPLLAPVWEDYARRVLPKDAGPNQVQETRRAFYAGALSALSLLPADPNASLHDAGARGRLLAELVRFQDAVAQGRA